LNRRRSRISLTDLLVLVGIVTIAAAVLSPAFSSAKDDSKQLKCLQNMKRLALGFRLYLDDYGKYPGAGPLFRAGATQGDWVICRTSNSTTNTMNIRDGSLFPYVKDTNLYMCPVDTHARKKMSGYPFGLSYAMNALLDWMNGTGGVRDTDVRHPAKCVVLVDEGAGAVNIVDGNSYPMVDGYFGYWADVPGLAHFDGSNFSFADGHVAGVKQADFSTLNYDPAL
jgi:prepilin-type processing-associated H-X9-DG protein